MAQVRYFLALCLEKNFTRAAKRSGVSQPTLTNAIKRLEQEFGGPLFERGRQQSRLTKLGILIQSDLAQIERSTTAAKRKAEKFFTARSGIYKPTAMEAFMRVHHALAVAAVIIGIVGVKLLFSPPIKAEAEIPPGMNVLQLQANHPNMKNMPVQDIHDMTFVFADGD
jgi:regulatory helix-turn-helix LysR family protein